VPVLIALVALAALVATAAPASASTAPASIPQLAQGAGMGATPSPAVRRVQRVLDRRGYDLGAPGVDGRFGPLTDAAVRRMQADKGLAVDGVVGTRTRKALGLTRRASNPQRRPAAAKPTQAKPTQPKPTQAKPTQTKPTPKATAPVATPKPTQSATANSTAKPDDGRSSFWLIALGAMDAFLALVLVLVVRSNRAAVRTADGPATIEAEPPAGADPSARLTPIDEELYLEGHSEQAGDFHGRAVASTLTPEEDRPEERRTRYLVDDPSKAQPIWVGESEIERSTTHATHSPFGSGRARLIGRRRAWPRTR
jgi:peptidoglycan hydrolase-like protein with peptidoglycan-binding domain